MGRWCPSAASAEELRACAQSRAGGHEPRLGRVGQPAEEKTVSKWTASLVIAKFRLGEEKSVDVREKKRREIANRL